MPTDTTLERPSPAISTLSARFLGAILLDNHALNTAIENVRPEDFFLDQHRRVYVQMIALGESQQAIDLITLTEELHRRGELEASGGAPYLSALADGMPRRFERRTLRAHCQRKGPAAQPDSRHAQHSAARARRRRRRGHDSRQRRVIHFCAGGRPREGRAHSNQGHRSRQFRAPRKNFREGKSITGIATGYTELDKLLSGLQNSELLILAARPVAR